MPEVVGELIASLGLDIAQFHRNAEAARQKAEEAAKKIDKSFGNVEVGLTRLGDSFKKVFDKTSIGKLTGDLGNVSVAFDAIKRDIAAIGGQAAAAFADTTGDILSIAANLGTGGLLGAVSSVTAAIGLLSKAWDAYTESVFRAEVAEEKRNKKFMEGLDTEIAKVRTAASAQTEGGLQTLQATKLGLEERIRKAEAALTTIQSKTAESFIKWRSGVAVSLREGEGGLFSLPTTPEKEKGIAISEAQRTVTELKGMLTGTEAGIIGLSLALGQQDKATEAARLAEQKLADVRHKAAEWAKAIAPGGSEETEAQEAWEKKWSWEGVAKRREEEERNKKAPFAPSSSLTANISRWGWEEPSMGAFGSVTKEAADALRRLAKESERLGEKEKQLAEAQEDQQHAASVFVAVLSGLRGGDLRQALSGLTDAKVLTGIRSFGDKLEALGGDIGRLGTALKGLNVPALMNALSSWIDVGIDAAKRLGEAFLDVGAALGDVFKSTVGAVGGKILGGVSTGGATEAVTSVISAFAGLGVAITTLAATLAFTAGPFWVAIGAVVFAAFGPLIIAAAGLAAGLFAVTGGMLALGMGLFMLSTTTESYRKFMAALQFSINVFAKALEPAFQNLIPLAGVLIMVNQGLAILLAQLIPGSSIARGLFEGLKVTGLATLELALGFLKVERIFLEVAKTIADKLGISNMEIDAEQRANDERRNAVQAQINALNAASYDSMPAFVDSVLEAAKAANTLTEALTNVPEGFKVARERWLSQDVREPTSSSASGWDSRYAPGTPDFPALWGR